MKSDTENITDMFYVGNNNNNKSLTNEPEIKGSWCCNIATCSRVPSGERVSKIAKLSTDTNFDDLKHVSIICIFEKTSVLIIRKYN